MISTRPRTINEKKQKQEKERGRSLRDSEIRTLNTEQRRAQRHLLPLARSSTSQAAGGGAAGGHVFGEWCVADSVVRSAPRLLLRSGRAYVKGERGVLGRVAGGGDAGSAMLVRRTLQCGCPFLAHAASCLFWCGPGPKRGVSGKEGRHVTAATRASSPAH